MAAPCVLWAEQRCYHDWHIFYRKNGVDPNAFDRLPGQVQKVTRSTLVNVLFFYNNIVIIVSLHKDKRLVPLTKSYFSDQHFSMETL
jgi:hypothetical protein